MLVTAIAIGEILNKLEELTTCDSFTAFVSAFGMRPSIAESVMKLAKMEQAWKAVCIKHSTYSPQFVKAASNVKHEVRTYLIQQLRGMTIVPCNFLSTGLLARFVTGRGTKRRIGGCAQGAVIGRWGSRTKRSTGKRQRVPASKSSSHNGQGNIAHHERQRGDRR